MKEPQALPDWMQEPAPNIREDWGDAASHGASVPVPVAGPESIAPVAYGPEENPNPVKDPGALAALGHALESGFWKQGSDEAIGGITAAVQPPGNGASWRMPDGATVPLNTRGDVYRAARDTERATLEAGQQTHPYLSLGGQIAGDMASDAVLKTFGVPVGGTPYQVSMGAIQAFLGDNGDLTRPTPENVTEAIERTGTGAALGYLAPKAGTYVGQKAGQGLRWAGGHLTNAYEGSGLQDWLTQASRERALKAAGYIQKDFARGAPMRDRLLNTTAPTLLEEPGLIGPFSSKAAIADRLEPLVEREGQKIGHALDTADAAATGAPWVGGTADDVPVAAPVGSTPGFNPYEFVETAQDEIATPAIRNPSLSAEGRGVETWLDRLRQTANEQYAENGQPMTFRQANEYKGDLQGTVFNPAGDVRKSKAIANQLQRSLTQSIDQQAAPFLGPEQLADFQQARRNYGAFVDALEHATQGANRDVGNNALGLKDWQAAQTFAEASQNTPGLGWAAPLVAVGSKVLRGRADSAAARALHGTETGLSDWLQSLEQTNPGVLGKYANYLFGAGARTPEAIGIIHNNLAETDPEYQQRMRALGGQSQ